MAMKHTESRTAESVMGFFWYSYFKACYFAGLFRRAMIPYLSEG